MARTIAEIHQSILVEKSFHQELDSLNSPSKVAIYNLWAYVTAVVMWTLENLFDLHKAEVDNIIATKKPHQLRWYREMALGFQFGQALIPDTGEYDNSGLSVQEVEQRRIIKQAAVTEVDGRLRIKVTKEVGGEFVPLDDAEYAAFKEYSGLRKDAGVRITVDSLPADLLKLELDIWYDPLVLRSDGSRIDGADQQPVKAAIKNYLKNLPFNGEFANSRLVDVLQQVDGVRYPVIRTSQDKYGLLPYTQIDEKYIPDAGFLRIDELELKINYRENV